MFVLSNKFFLLLTIKRGFCSVRQLNSWIIDQSDWGPVNQILDGLTDWYQHCEWALVLNFAFNRFYSFLFAFNRYKFWNAKSSVENGTGLLCEEEINDRDKNATWQWAPVVECTGMGIPGEKRYGEKKIPAAKNLFFPVSFFFRIENFPYMGG